MATPPMDPPILPSWLQERLQNISRHPRALGFEASLYGTLNTYLCTYFPVSRHFMVNPSATGTLQPAVDAPATTVIQDVMNDADDFRSEDWDQLEKSQASNSVSMKGAHEEGKGGAEEDGEDEDEDENMEEDGVLGNISMDTADSYGQHPEPGTKGTMIPDFVVVKATGALDGDTIVLVVEVKKRQWSQAKALFQLSDYLMSVDKKNCAQRLRGILIRGRVSTALEVVRIDGEPMVLTTDHEMQTNGDRFNEYVNRVAAENWA